MSNPYLLFKGLIPETPLQVGTVSALGAPLHQITLVDGGVITARGEATLGQKVFVRNGVIEGEAPNLGVELIEI